MKYCHYICLNFETVDSNLEYSGFINNIRVNIKGNKLLTISYYKTNKTIDFEDHYKIDEEIIYDFSGIGLIMDIITLVTELIISPDYNGIIFDHNERIIKYFYDKERSFNDIYKEINKLKKLTSIGMQSNFYYPIKNETVKFSDEKIKDINYLFDCFFIKSRINTTLISFLNYWRKGLILFNLHYMEESFLNFYKILEFFLAKYKSVNLVDKLIEEYDIKDYSIAKRLIESFVKIRNNYDIAHTRIKRIKRDSIENRDEFFNLSFYDNFWEKYYDIKDVVKYLILRYMNIKKLDFYIGKLNSLDIKVRD